MLYMVSFSLVVTVLLVFILSEVLNHINWRWAFYATLEQTALYSVILRSQTGVYSRWCSQVKIRLVKFIRVVRP